MEKPGLLADSTPLGLGAFATCAFWLSLINSGLVPPPLIQAFIAPLIFFGGMIQILVGAWEIKRNNVFAATAFGTYGSFLLSFGFLIWLQVAHVIDLGKYAHMASGVFVLGYLIVSVYLLLISFRTEWFMVMAFLIVVVELLLLALADFGLMSEHIAGWVGILLAVVIWYGAAAKLLNAVEGRIVLPLGEIRKHVENVRDGDRLEVKA